MAADERRRRLLRSLLSDGPVESVAARTHARRGSHRLPVGNLQAALLEVLSRNLPGARPGRSAGALGAAGPSHPPTTDNEETGPLAGLSDQGEGIPRRQGGGTMASDISDGPTSATDTKGAPRRVAAARSHATVRSRLAFALCLLLAAALGAASMSACGGSGTESASPAAVVSGTPVALATPATAQEVRGMLPVVFTLSLVKRHGGGSSKTVGDVVQMRHVMWTYRNQSSDPRLSGRWVVVFNVDQRQADMSGRLWGTIRLSNQGGTWVGKCTGGIAAAGDVHHCYASLKGTGGYAGLVSRSSGLFVEAGEGFTPDIQIVNAGWIETTDGSPVPPAPGPGSTPSNWTPVVGIATMKETAYDA